MSMATPFEPEPESSPRDDAALPADDLTEDDERFADSGTAGVSDEDDELAAALHEHEPKGFTPPRAGGGIDDARLREDLGEDPSAT